MSLTERAQDVLESLPSSGLVNVGDSERAASLVGGVLLGALALQKRSPLLALAAGGLVYRGAVGRCYLYQALGVNTAERNAATAVPARQGAKVEASIIITRPPQEVYAFWRKLENLPKFMSNLVSVTENLSGVSHWVAKGPAGTTVEWDAEVINEHEPEMISWRSLEGSEVDNAGSVRFNPVGTHSTEVVVSMKYNPPAGKIGIALAKVLGQDPKQALQEDLRKLKTLLEAESAASPQQPTEQQAATGQ